LEQKSINLEPDFFYSRRVGDNISEEDILSSPYLYSDIIYSMCSTITNNVLKINWSLKDTSSQTTIEFHPILSLLKNPNPWINFTILREQIVTGLLLPSGTKKEDTGGQIFLVGTSGKSKSKYVNFRNGEVPTQLFCFWEKRKQYSFKAELDNNNNFLFWKLEFNGSSQIEKFSYDQVIRINYINPDCLYKGLAWSYPAFELLNQEILTNIYNSAFFKNDGRVSGILSTDSELTDQQRKNILTSWALAYSGSGNNSKVAIVSDGLKYTQFAPSHTDMQFGELKDRIYDRLLSCMKLNKIAMGNYEQINYATIKEGRRLLDQGTYLPLNNHILDQINSQWIQYIGNGKLAFESDVSGLDTMQPDYSTIVPMYVALVNSGVPPVLAANKLGIPFSEQELSDYPELLEVRQQQPQFSFGMSNNDKNSKNKKEDIEEDEVDEEEDNEEAERKPKKKYYKKGITEYDKKAITIKYNNNIIAPIEKNVVTVLWEYFDWYKSICLSKTRNISLKAIKSNGNVKEYIKNVYNYKTVNDINIDDYLPNKKVSKAKMKNIIKSMIKDTVQAIETHLPNETLGRIEWSAEPETYSKYLKERLERIDMIETTTMQVFGDRIKQALEESYDGNLDVIETAQLIRDYIGEANEIRKNQSYIIARTEMGSISSEARMDAYKDNDVQYVEWSAAHDDKTRDSHVAADQQGSIKLGDKFVNGLTMPNEFGAPADEVIGCRCVLLVSEKELE